MGTAKTPRKSAAKSSKTHGRGPVKSAQSTKSARARSATSSKTRMKRPNSATLGVKVDRCVATLDGWRKECTAKLRKLMRDRAAQGRGATKGRRARKQHGVQTWFKSSARQVSLGVRRGAELADPRKLFTESSKKKRVKQFNRVAKFCKKEWKELAALVAKLDSLANHPPQRVTTKRK